MAWKHGDNLTIIHISSVLPAAVRCGGGGLTASHLVCLVQRVCLCKATRCQNWEVTKPVSVLRWRRLLLRCLDICSTAPVLASLACISQTNQNSSSSSHSAAHLIDTQTINTDSIHQPFIVGGILSSCNQSLLITGDELLSTRHPPPGTSDCFPRSINGSIPRSGGQCGEVVHSRRRPLLGPSPG